MEKIGEIKANSKGTLMKIIAYRSSSDIDVEFLDDFHYTKEHQLYSNFKNGTIKNPYDRTIYNVGYLGVGKHMARDSVTHKMVKAYTVWVDIFERCYSEKYKQNHLSYYGICTVCDEWHNYQNFADWFEENYYEIGNERLHLDKDILVAGNKVYSPDTCILIPHRLNVMFLNRMNNKGLPNGIHKCVRGYGVIYKSKSYGIYQTLTEAYDKYRLIKESKIKILADEYKDVIPKKVYDAIVNYRFKLELDKNTDKIGFL